MNISANVLSSAYVSRKIGLIKIIKPFLHIGLSTLLYR